MKNLMEFVKKYIHRLMFLKKKDMMWILFILKMEK